MWISTFRPPLVALRAIPFEILRGGRNEKKNMWWGPRKICRGPALSKICGSWSAKKIKYVGGSAKKIKICEGDPRNFPFHSAPLRISNGIALRWSAPMTFSPSLMVHWLKDAHSLNFKNWYPGVNKWRDSLVFPETFQLEAALVAHCRKYLSSCYRGLLFTDHVSESYSVSPQHFHSCISLNSS